MSHPDLFQGKETTNKSSHEQRVSPFLLGSSSAHPPGSFPNPFWATFKSLRLEDKALTRRLLPWSPLEVSGPLLDPTSEPSTGAQLAPYGFSSKQFSQPFYEMQIFQVATCSELVQPPFGSWLWLWRADSIGLASLRPPGSQRGKPTCYLFLCHNLSY